MKRFGFVLAVAFLTLSFSGLAELVAHDPCSIADSASEGPDGACPATCLRCHCATAFDVAPASATIAIFLLRHDSAAPVPSVAVIPPHEILHVPL